MIIEWLTHVTSLIRTGRSPRDSQDWSESFQCNSRRCVSTGNVARDKRDSVQATSVPDFLVYANRLFDPDREFDGVRGIAYGGPDLSARNLDVLANLRLLEHQGVIPVCKFRSAPLATSCLAESRLNICCEAPAVFRFTPSFNCPAANTQ